MGGRGQREAKAHRAAMAVPTVGAALGGWGWWKWHVDDFEGAVFAHKVLELDSPCLFILHFSPSLLAGLVSVELAAK